MTEPKFKIGDIVVVRFRKDSSFSNRLVQGTAGIVEVVRQSHFSDESPAVYDVALQCPDMFLFGEDSYTKEIVKCRRQGIGVFEDELELLEGQ